MTKLTERELERLLAADTGGEPSPEPPAGLAERIKAEIPADLPRPGIDLEAGEARRPVWSAHRWRLAAVLAMTLTGGSLGWWAWQDAPRLASEPAQEAAPTSATSVPATADLNEALADRGPSLGEREAAPVAALQASALESAAAEQGPAGEREREDARQRSSAPAESTEADRLSALGYVAPRAVAPPRRPAAGTELPKPKPDQSDQEAAVWVGGEADITFHGGPPRAEGSDESTTEQRRERREEVGRRLQALSRRSDDGQRVEAKKVPIPDPTPQEAEPSVRGEEAELLQYGYYSTETQIIPEPPAHVPAPAPPPPAAPSNAAPLTVAPSTGGTAEPNDQAFGDVFFEHAGVNPFLDADEDPLSTFGLDVDTGSWGVVRRYLEDGHLPPKSAVRVEEIVNALDYGDPAPREGDFALTAEGAPSPFAGEGAAAGRYRVLRFAVKAREIREVDRKPAALIFVVDVSGSMAREDRLGLVKQSLRMLVERLSADDRVGLVIYGSRGEIVLEATSDHAAILAAIDRLAPGGATNAEEGLKLGYEAASRALRPGAINRVILCSDGVANVGATGPDSILERIQKETARGIELTTLGFGMGNYNDVLMERLADAGDGRYAYLDSLDEARRILVEQLTGTLETVAGEARAQVELNPEVVERYRLLGYENRDIADERFRDDTVDAGEIGAGHTVTALYEVKLREGLEAPAGARAFRNEPVATLRLRWRSVAAGEFVETAEVLRVGDLQGSWGAASPALRLASLAAEMAEILRGSYWARGGSLDDVFRRLQRLGPELAGNRQAAELTALAGRAAGLAAAAGEPGRVGADE